MEIDKKKIQRLLEEAETNARQLERSGNLNTIHHENAAKYRELLKQKSTKVERVDEELDNG